MRVPPPFGILAAAILVGSAPAAAQQASRGSGSESMELDLAPAVCEVRWNDELRDIAEDLAELHYEDSGNRHERYSRILERDLRPYVAEAARYPDALRLAAWAEYRSGRPEEARQHLVSYVERVPWCRGIALAERSQLELPEREARSGEEALADLEAAYLLHRPPPHLRESRISQRLLREALRELLRSEDALRAHRHPNVLEHLQAVANGAPGDLPELPPSEFRPTGEQRRHATSAIEAGRGYLSSGGDTRALARFWASVLTDPSHVGGWIGLAESYLRLGRDAEATVAVERALRLSPSSDEARELGRRVLQEREGVTLRMPLAWLGPLFDPVPSDEDYCRWRIRDGWIEVETREEDFTCVLEVLETDHPVRVSVEVEKLDGEREGAGGIGVGANPWWSDFAPGTVFLGFTTDYYGGDADVFHLSVPDGGWRGHHANRAIPGDGPAHMTLEVFGSQVASYADGEELSRVRSRFAYDGSVYLYAFRGKFRFRSLEVREFPPEYFEPGDRFHEIDAHAMRRQRERTTLVLSTPPAPEPARRGALDRLADAVRLVAEPITEDLRRQNAELEAENRRRLTELEEEARRREEAARIRREQEAERRQMEALRRQEAERRGSAEPPVAGAPEVVSPPGGREGTEGSGGAPGRASPAPPGPAPTDPDREPEPPGGSPSWVDPTSPHPPCRGVGLDRMTESSVRARCDLHRRNADLVEGFRRNARTITITVHSSCDVDHGDQREGSITGEAVDLRLEGAVSSNRQLTGAWWGNGLPGFRGGGVILPNAPEVRRENWLSPRWRQYALTYDARRYAGGPQVTFQWSVSSPFQLSQRGSSTVPVRDGGVYDFQGRSTGALPTCFR